MPCHGGLGRRRSASERAIAKEKQKSSVPPTVSFITFLSVLAFLPHALGSSSFPETRSYRCSAPDEIENRWCPSPAPLPSSGAVRPVFSRSLLPIAANIGCRGAYHTLVRTRRPTDAQSGSHANDLPLFSLLAIETAGIRFKPRNRKRSSPSVASPPSADSFLAASAVPFSPPPPLYFF